MHLFPTCFGALCLVGTLTGAEFTVNEAVEQALKRNQSLKIARHEIARAQNRLNWSGRLDNPELEISGATDALGNREGEGSLSLAFSQSFPITDRLRQERDIHRVQVLLAMAEVDAARRALAYRAHRLAVEILSRKQMAGTRRRMIATQSEFLQFVEAKVKTAEMSPLDVTQAKLELENLRRELALGEAEIDPYRFELEILLELPAGSKLDVTGILAFPEKEPSQNADIGIALRNRPDYHAVLLQYNLAQAGINVEVSRRWADLTVRVFAEHERTVDKPDGLGHNNLIGVGISIPLPFRQRNETEINDAVIRARAAADNIAYQKSSVGKEIAAALAARDLAWKIAREASGESVALARKNYEDFLTAYQSGQTDMARLQDARKLWIRQEETALDLQRRFHLAEVDLRHVLCVYPGYHPSLQFPNK